MHNFPYQLSYVLTLHENILKQNMHAFFLLGRLSVVLLPSTLAAFTKTSLVLTFLWKFFQQLLCNTSFPQIHSLQQSELFK